jgi:isocitrate dehydrogenase kinase/phosphatase
MMRIEKLIAQTILQGFDAQYGRFLEVTAGAQQRFEQADWPAVQQAMKQRINLYDSHVALVAEQLRCLFGSRVLDDGFVARVKVLYSDLLPDHPRFEIAESFFNSVYCRLFHHRKLTADKFFINTSQTPREWAQLLPSLARVWPVTGDLTSIFNDIFSELSLRLGWENRERDVHYICQTLIQRFGYARLQACQVEIHHQLFFRNKVAWLVGKLRFADAVYPLLMPILLNAQGQLFVDACLSEEDDASIVFGFARSYFMVYTPLPGVLVSWLREILPAKTTAELYSAIGCQKHAKTEYYREHLQFMARGNQPFIIAPGVKGMVMLVFTLAGSDRVFKVIKDSFAPQKTVSEAQVKACYKLVKEHDRVGRMADTQEYENFVLPRGRISPSLLQALQQDIPSKLEDHGDWLVIRHLYMERRMTPLNLYLEQASDSQRHAIIDDYGLAIKQLAAANIFPGDMLCKNFGVTRHGRVIFYDYDEICYMSEVNFRNIPASLYPEQDLAAEPWYSIAEHDVFPEEFLHFLWSDKASRELFSRLHGELLSADYWRSLQQRLAQGWIDDVYAYPLTRRFCNYFANQDVA